MDNQINNSPNASSSLTIYKVKDFEGLYKIWPAVLESVAKTGGGEELLERLLNCISRGAVFVVEQSGAFFGLCSIEVLDNDNAVIHALPTAPASSICMKTICEWAKDQGISHIKLVSHRLNGSNFHYIEKTLGFHREAMVFVKHINLYG